MFVKQEIYDIVYGDFILYDDTVPYILYALLPICCGILAYHLWYKRSAQNRTETLLVSVIAVFLTAIPTIMIAIMTHGISGEEQQEAIDNRLEKIVSVMHKELTTVDPTIDTVEPMTCDTSCENRHRYGAQHSIQGYDQEQQRKWVRQLRDDATYPAPVRLHYDNGEIGEIVVEYDKHDGFQYMTTTRQPFFDNTQ